MDENEQFDIEDESGDRKYFTIVPNYILNHSTMWDREVYIQMKRIAGDRGKCWTSRTTLAKQCGMSVRRLDQCLKYLLEHDWIRKVGTRKIAASKGGLQQVYEYKIVDLWKKNVAFYEGGAGDALPKQKGVQEVHQGGAGDAHKEEPYQEEHSGVAPLREVVVDSDEEMRPRSKPKYPNAREAASWLPFTEPSWFINTTELKHLELLFSRGEKAVKSLVRFIAKHKDDPYCPKFTKPSDLERKWRDYQDYADKND